MVIYPALIRPSLTDTLYKKAKVAVVSVTGAVLLTLLFSMAVLRALGNIGHMLDRAASGEYLPEILPSEKAATDELSIMASKVNLLGQRLRGAQFEVSDLRGNIDHLLQDLEDAVFIFNREFRLVFASGSVEKFLGHDRSDLTGQLLSDLFPPATMLGLLVAQAVADGPRHPKPAGSARRAAAKRGRVPRSCCSRWTFWKACRADRPLPAESWSGCAIPKRSARSIANCRRRTGFRPSAGSPAGWPTR